MTKNSYARHVFRGYLIRWPMLTSGKSRCCVILSARTPFLFWKAAAVSEIHFFKRSGALRLFRHIGARCLAAGSCFRGIACGVMTIVNGKFGSSCGIRRYIRSVSATFQATLSSLCFDMRTRSCMYALVQSLARRSYEQWLLASLVNGDRRHRCNYSLPAYKHPILDAAA